MSLVYQTVLIGNDTDSNARNAQILTQNGISHTCKISVNAGIALLFLQQQCEKIRDNSRLIIIDINTPIMNGFEFLSELRNSKVISSQNTMIVAIKDNLSTSQLDKLKIMGVHNFIEGTICPNQLTNLVKDFFELKKAKSTRNGTKLQGYAA